MFTSKGDYDRGVNTFSPEGRLFQVEYALSAIKLGSTAIGICCVDSVILATERRVKSPLLDICCVQKIMKIDNHVGCAMSGLMADARTLINHARVEAQNHFFVFNEPIPVQSCVEAISDLALDFSDSTSGRKKKIMSRPFGVALLIGGVDGDGPALWCTDPSGTNTRFEAAAIGCAEEGAQAVLHENYKKAMNLEEGEVLALVVLRHVMEEKLSLNNIELARVDAASRMYKKYSPEEVQIIIDRLPPPTVPNLTSA